MRELGLVTSSVSRVTRAGDSIFFLRTDTGAVLPKLVVRVPGGAERVLFDPEQARKGDAPHLSIDNFSPSRDGRFVAVNVAPGGSEITSVHVLETATGTMRPDLVERIWGEMAVSWLPDATGFFYTQMREPDPKAGATDIQQGQRVRFHRLGAPPADDPVVLGVGVNPKMPFDPGEFPFIQVPAASDWAFAGAGGARPEGRLCAAPRADVRDARGPWQCIAEYEDSVEDVAVHGSDVYLLSSKGAPNRRVLRVRLPAASLAEAETGGGEKGRAWYLAGKGPNKRNGVRDFIACAEYLSANGYSRPSRTGAFSQSAGGILVGGAITERPDAFGAAVIGAGILNPVRMLEGVNGANQIPEFGDPRTADGSQALMAMDPYYHAKPGVRYPALMLTVGLNDNRVSPWHSGKFAARVQAATASRKPVLIRIDEEAGHGIGSMRDQMAEQTGDMFAFLLWQLGDPGFQPGASIGSAAPATSVLGTSFEFQPMFFIQYAKESTRKVPEHPNTAVRVHSVWIAVKNLEAAAKAYEAVGLRSVGNVQVPALAATGRQIEAGRGVIVLLQAKDASGPLASHVSQYGEGVVGVSIEVRDLDAARSRIQASTKRPLEPYSGPFGTSILVTPESTHGMWMEFFGKTGA